MSNIVKKLGLLSAFVLADSRGHRVVMVTCDIIGFRRTVTNRVKDRVKDKFGRFVVRGFHRDHNPLQRSDRPRLIRGAPRIDRRQRGPRCGQENSSEVMEAGAPWRHDHGFCQLKPQTN
jgi:hypothetical protein